MNILALISAILQAAPEELALVEALIGIVKGTHAVVSVTQTNPSVAQASNGGVFVTPVTPVSETVTAAPVVPATEAAASVIPPNGKKEVLT